MDQLKKKKGPSNYINHSWEPNCKLRQWGIDGLPLMCFFANKDIKCGEELTIHYNWELAVKNKEECKEKATKCKCKTQKCDRFIEKMILEKTTKPGRRTRKRTRTRP